MKTFFTTVLLATLTWAHGDHSGHMPEPTPTPAPVVKAHLTFKDNTVHVHAQFVKSPEVGTESFLSIETRSAKDHSLIAIDDSVSVELWMPDMGHGSVPTQIERVLDKDGNAEAGKFLVSNVYFVMGGLWDIQVTLTDKSGNSETKTFSLTLADDTNH